MVRIFLWATHFCHPVDRKCMSWFWFLVIQNLWERLKSMKISYLHKFWPIGSVAFKTLFKVGVGCFHFTLYWQKSQINFLLFAATTSKQLFRHSSIKGNSLPCSLPACGGTILGGINEMVINAPFCHVVPPSPTSLSKQKDQTIHTSVCGHKINQPHPTKKSSTTYKNEVKVSVVRRVFSLPCLTNCWLGTRCEQPVFFSSAAH